MNVDPNLNEIRIVFSRPMDEDTLFIPIDNTVFPELKDEFRWEADYTTLVLGVNLRPDTQYGYGLNSESAFGFSDVKGNPLLPVKIRFKTRARR
jgi:hypothetical protein